MMPKGQLQAFPSIQGFNRLMGGCIRLPKYENQSILKNLSFG